MTVDPGVTDKRLFVLDEEFSGVMANTKREGNVLSMTIRQLWDSGSLSPLTKNNKISVTNAHVGWTSHITLHELNTRLGETEAFNGFANRILWVCAKRQKLVPWPTPMNSDTLADLQYRLAKIITKCKAEVTIKPDSEVKRIWSEKYYRKTTQHHPGLVGCVINRSEAQVLRLAMIYCLLDGGRVIRLPHLESALAFWNYCQASAELIFHGRQQDNTAQKILEALQEKNLTGKEINRLFHSHVSKETLDVILSELLASGRIEKSQESTGGRPVTIYKKINILSVQRVLSVQSPIKQEPEGLNTLCTLNTQESFDEWEDFQ